MSESGVKPIRAISGVIGRARIEADRFTLCRWCGALARPGTLITFVEWELGNPRTFAAFVCDDCYLAIVAADLAYLAEHGIESTKKDAT